MSVAAAGARSLADVVRGRSEWRPWLAVLEAVAEASGDRGWRPAVPESPASADPGAPLLTGATLAPDARLVRRWSRRLLETAAQAGGAAAALAVAARAGDDALAELLESGLVQDAARLNALAVRLGVEPEALAAVAGVIAIPLLRACAERWRERVPATWSHGYCPLCGAWPALSEARGLERARRLRCGRCTGDWPFAWLRCAYCGEDDHERLGSLVVERLEGADARHQSIEDGGVETTPPSPPRFARSADTVSNPPSRANTADPVMRMTMETCGACRGYLKAITALGPTPADELLMLDLATVELDVAVLEQGYRRPAGVGAPLGARVQPRASGLLGGWRG